ncbi:MAG: metal ion ABC transporter substrate-binding protein [Halobacteriovoraceae bacterium]|nr:metal ion ABC transporter substrate-binding protein [Halobacteriovoraceae bacterium]
MIFKTIILLLISSISYAKINVITTTTDLQWLTKQIGGEKVKVESLLNGTEDPHYLDAMPHFISKVANADMFCLVGLDLEVGWAPKILSRSGNKKVQPGGKGYCETGKTIKALNIPTGRVDRSQGDVHPQGNPHYHLGPDALYQGGETILNTLINIDTKNASYYLKNYESLKVRLNKIKLNVSKILEPAKGMNLIEYHREFTYFFKEFGLNNQGAIEAVPGVPPSAGRLARVSIKARDSKVSLALATTTSPLKITNKFMEMSQVPVTRLPLSIASNGYPSNYEELLTNIAKSIVDNAKKYE